MGIRNKKFWKVKIFRNGLPHDILSKRQKTASGGGAYSAPMHLRVKRFRVRLEQIYNSMGFLRLASYPSPYMFYMSKKSCPIFTLYSLYGKLQDFLDIQYIYKDMFVNIYRKSLSMRLKVYWL